jgi:Fibronectin type III domain/Domain of unknown function (DUF5122) beta-propeller
MIRRSFQAAALAVVTALALAPGAVAEPLGATSWMSRTWGVDGRVSELVATSAGVVVGGSFTTAIAPSGATRPAASLALWNPESGTFANWPVTVAGEVLAAAVVGDTVYLGGDFTTVNGASRRNLAAVRLSTGALLPWSPRAFGAVETLAAGGGSVYVGGAFTSVQDASATTTVDRIARVGADGSLDRTWTASIRADDRVRVLLVTPTGDALYVGGDFTALGGSSTYGRLARVGTGATAVIDTSFRSGPNNNSSRSPVFDLDLVGDSLLIASGGGGGGCTRQDAATGRTLWSHHGTGDVVAVKALGPYVYCGGHFSGTDSFEGLDRYKVAEVVQSTGVITAWAPRVNSALGIWAMADTPSALVVGGDFTRTNGNYQPHLGQFRDRSSLTVPSAPVGLQAVPGDTQVTLQWARPDTDGGAPVSRYLVLRAKAAGDFTQVGNTASTSFTDTGLSNGATYRYAVRASSSVGDGPASAPVSVIPDGGLLFPPTVPRSFVVTGGASAVMSWQEPASDGGSPVTGYTLYRTVAGGGESLLGQVGAAARSAEDQTCPLRETCTYRMAAVNEVGEGARTGAISVIGNTGVPATPVLTASAGPGVAVSLSWTISSPGAAPLTRFIVLRDGVRRATTSGTARSFVDTSVVRGRSYVYQVRAVNDYGNSQNSAPVTVTVP